MFAAKLNIKKLMWDQTEDNVTFKVYCSSTGVLDYESPSETVTVTQAELAEGFCNLTHGLNYLIGVAQVNDYGNESDIVPEGGLSFTPNFLSPLPAINVRLQ
jgi:hypothetical protein